MIRVLGPDHYRVMPWKNGGGTTTEIYIHPPGAGWDAFEWRVGIADIAQSGPFSSFPGIDRSIMLLHAGEDSGMRLAIDGRDVELPLHRFVDFAGEATTHAALTGDPVRDFNVMSRRAAIRHRCAFERLAAGASREMPAAAWNFAFVMDGQSRVTGSSGAVTLQTGASVLVDDEPLRIAAMGEGCRVIVAAFEKRAEAAAGVADTRGGRAHLTDDVRDEVADNPAPPCGARVEPS